MFASWRWCCLQNPRLSSAVMLAVGARWFPRAIALFGTRANAALPSRRAYPLHWANARIKIVSMLLTIKLNRNWNSFQLANSAPPLNVTDSAIAPSARIRKLTLLDPFARIPVDKARRDESKINHHLRLRGDTCRLHACKTCVGGSAHAWGEVRGPKNARNQADLTGNRWKNAAGKTRKHREIDGAKGTHAQRT